MTRVLSIVFGITVLALIASGLTEASLALSSHQTTSPEPVHKAAVEMTPKAPVVATPAPAPTPTPAIPAAPALPTATVNGFVHMRSAATTSSSIVTDLNAGDVVQYSQVDTGLWQAITFQGTNGYIYKTYLTY